MGLYGLAPLWRLTQGIYPMTQKSDTQIEVDRHLKAGLIKRNGRGFIRTKAGLAARLDSDKVRYWSRAIKAGLIK
jgi:hypothetical protein